MNTHRSFRRLLAAALLSTVVLGASGCGGDTSGTVQATDTAQTPEPAAVAELSASPGDRLEAAVVRTLTAGPIRVTAVADGVTTESQLDYSKRVTYSVQSGSGESNPVHSVYMRDDIVLVRFAQDTDGARADTWYRIPGDAQVNQMLAMSFDVDWVTQLIMSASAIAEDGTDEVNGSPATHFVVTPDTDALVDLALAAMPAQSEDAAAREAMKERVPSALHYWVDDDGYLVKEDDGFQVKTYHDFGVPLDLPALDESAVEAVPGS